MKNLRIALIVLMVLSIPTFFQMLRSGIYSMQDFHLFRLYEFDRCVKDLQLPCRWSPDVGLEYGQPLFNFYTQLPYALGEFFVLAGLSKIDTIKLLFIFSLVGSSVSMFFLAQRFWRKTSSALVSGIIYLYAPYRAVDVWVRGAPPEALAFLLSPAIILFFNNYLSSKKTKDLILFSVLFAVLINVHNLSALMLSPFLVLWGTFVLFQNKGWRKIFLPLIGALLFSFSLSSFYLIPVIAESNLVHLNYTISGYFDFRGHFAAINQILFSRFWGYGGSVFGTEDGLSLSVGLIQWALPLFAILVFFAKNHKDRWKVLVLVLIGWISLFFTHNRSAFIWEKVSALHYLQFPWRWLSIAVFSFSLASGSILVLVKKYEKVVCGLIVLAVIVQNVTFFREDIWYKINDQEQFSGEKWEQQIASSIGDYLPATAFQFPFKIAPPKPSFLDGSGSSELVEKKSNKLTYKLNVDTDSQVQFPVAFFPGWGVSVNGQKVLAQPSGEYGLVTANVPKGSHTIVLNFSDTVPRKIGNIVSAASITGLLILYIVRRRSKNAA